MQLRFWAMSFDVTSEKFDAGAALASDITLPRNVRALDNVSKCKALIPPKNDALSLLEVKVSTISSQVAQTTEVTVPRLDQISGTNRTAFCPAHVHRELFFWPFFIANAGNSWSCPYQHYYSTTARCSWDLLWFSACVWQTFQYGRCCSCIGDPHSLQVLQDVEESWTSPRHPLQQEKRHVRQLFVRGDNICSVSRMDGGVPADWVKASLVFTIIIGVDFKGKWIVAVIMIRRSGMRQNWSHYIVSLHWSLFIVSTQQQVKQWIGSKLYIGYRM